MHKLNVKSGSFVTLVFRKSSMDIGQYAYQLMVMGNPKELLATAHAKICFALFHLIHGLV